jgi:hypothetical protein
MKRHFLRAFTVLSLVLPAFLFASFVSWLVAVLFGRFTATAFDFPTIWIFLPPGVLMSGALMTVVLYQQISAPLPPQGPSPRTQGFFLVGFGLVVGGGVGFYYGHTRATELEASYTSDCQRLAAPADFDACMKRIEWCRKRARTSVCAVVREQVGRYRIGPELPDDSACLDRVAERLAEVRERGLSTSKIVYDTRGHRVLSDVCVIEKLSELGDTD